MTLNLERRQLGRSSVMVTALGFGGGPLGRLSTGTGEAVATATVDAAWNEGVRYFDTAPLYGIGRSERRLPGTFAQPLLPCPWWALQCGLTWEDKSRSSGILRAYYPMRWGLKAHGTAPGHADCWRG